VGIDHECHNCAPFTFNRAGDTTIGTCDDTDICDANEHVKSDYSSSTKKYGPSTCANEIDCIVKCGTDGQCEGLSATNHITQIAVAGMQGICAIFYDESVACRGKSSQANTYWTLGIGKNDQVQATYYTMSQFDGSNDAKKSSIN
jgi:hypothetical protein